MKFSGLFVLVVLFVALLGVVSIEAQDVATDATTSSPSSSTFVPPKKKHGRHAISVGCKLLKEKEKYASQVADSYNENLILIQALQLKIDNKDGMYPGRYEIQLEDIKNSNNELIAVITTLNVQIDALGSLCKLNETLPAVSTTVPSTTSSN